MVRRGVLLKCEAKRGAVQRLRLTWLLRVCVTHPRFSHQKHHHHHFLRLSTTSTNSFSHHHHYYFPSFILSLSTTPLLPSLPNHHYHHHHFFLLSASSPQLFPIIPLLPSLPPLTHSYPSSQKSTQTSPHVRLFFSSQPRFTKGTQMQDASRGLGGKNN